MHMKVLRKYQWNTGRKVRFNKCFLTKINDDSCKSCRSYNKTCTKGVDIELSCHVYLVKNDREHGST